MEATHQDALDAMPVCACVRFKSPRHTTLTVCLLVNFHIQLVEQLQCEQPAQRTCSQQALREVHTKGSLVAVAAKLRA